MNTGADPTAIPLTVIGGFLGAGKTTLLNRVLRENTGVRYAVMVNDFGDLAVDDALITSHDGDTISFANGCVCCTLGADFMLAMDNILQRRPAPEHILVEASGVADPRAIADMAELHGDLQRDLTVVLADASNIQARAKDELLSDTVARQLAAADLIVLNKCDLSDDAGRAALRQWLGERSSAPVVETSHSDLPLQVLNGRPQLRENRPGGSHEHPQGDDHDHDHDHGHGAVHDHGDIFRAHGLTFEDTLDLTLLRRVLSELPATVLRVKGFVRAGGEGSWHLVQWSGGSSDMRPAPAYQGPAFLTVIGVQEMPAEADLRTRLAAALTQKDG